MDPGVEVADALGDSAETVSRIPEEPDFLYAFSTVAGEWLVSSTPLRQT